MSDWLLTQQQSDGPWRMDRTTGGPAVGVFDGTTGEPPVDQGDPGDTAYASWAIFTANSITAKSQYADALTRAAKWFRQTSFVTTQDVSLTLVGMKAGGLSATDADRQRVRALLKSQQHPDGGWGETDKLGSNAYATGQALYALRLSGEGVEQPDFRQGIIWLLDHQQADGSWRLEPSQTQRPSRFAATMWAVVGIGEIFDVKTESEFLSLIHAGQRSTILSPIGVALFLLLLPVLLIPLIFLRPHRQAPQGVRR
jgi:hypothetical protein